MRTLAESSDIVPLSAETIRERIKPIVKAPETLDFKTLLPERGGLFDYRVFGPGTVIDAGEIDDDPAKPRKTNFARLVLAAPIAHPAFAPDHIARQGGWSPAELATWCTTEDGVAYATLVDRLDASVDGHALVMRELPVLPPDLRPLTRLPDDRWQVSPLNEHYRRVIRQNARVDPAKPADRRALADAIAALFALIETVGDPRAPGYRGTSLLLALGLAHR